MQLLLRKLVIIHSFFWFDVILTDEVQKINKTKLTLMVMDMISACRNQLTNSNRL